MQPQDTEFVMLRNSPRFMGPEGSLLNLQEPTTKENLQQFIMQECRGTKVKSTDWMLPIEVFLIGPIICVLKHSK
jgi:hypothetical protein